MLRHSGGAEVSLQEAVKMIHLLSVVVSQA